MAHNIWKLLGIEPTKDVSAIKRAYTSLAHDINPEDDPDRFAELHEAYKKAIDYANGRVTIAEIKEPVPDTAFAMDSDDEFDFSQLDTEILRQNSVSDIIVDDIIEFRNSNRLTSFAEIRKLPQKLRIELANKLLNMYYSLAVRSNEPVVWEAFWDEPLIRYCDAMGGFRSWIFAHFEDDSPHRAKLMQVIEERAKAEREKYELPADPGKEEKKKNYSKAKIIIFVLALVFILILIPVFCIFRPDPDMFAIIGAIILMAGVGFAMYYVAKSLH